MCDKGHQLYTSVSPGGHSQSFLTLENVTHTFPDSWHKNDFYMCLCPASGLKLYSHFWEASRVFTWAFPHDEARKGTAALFQTRFWLAALRGLCESSGGRDAMLGLQVHTWLQSAFQQQHEGPDKMKRSAATLFALWIQNYANQPGSCSIIQVKENINCLILIDFFSALFEPVEIF